MPDADPATARVAARGRPRQINRERIVSAARDLARVGVRVCTIAPGTISTPMLAGVTPEFQKTLAEGIPFPQRLGEPDEYAQLAEFIVAHNYLNGETIRMDGAIRMAPR